MQTGIIQSSMMTAILPTGQCYIVLSTWKFHPGDAAFRRNSLSTCDLFTTASNVNQLLHWVRSLPQRSTLMKCLAHLNVSVVFHLTLVVCILYSNVFRHLSPSLSTGNWINGITSESGRHYRDPIRYPYTVYVRYFGTYLATGRETDDAISFAFISLTSNSTHNTQGEVTSQ